MIGHYKGTCKVIQEVCRYICIVYLIVVLGIMVIPFLEGASKLLLPVVLSVNFFSSMVLARMVNYAQHAIPCTFTAGRESVTFKVGGFLQYNIKYCDICSMKVAVTKRAGEEISFILLDKELKFTAWNANGYSREEIDADSGKLPDQICRFSKLKRFIEEQKQPRDPKQTDEIIDGLWDWLDYSHK